MEMHMTMFTGERNVKRFVRMESVCVSESTKDKWKRKDERSWQFSASSNW